MAKISCNQLAIDTAHCYVVDIGKLIVSRYVAESITTDAGRFSHIGFCQLRTKLTTPKRPASVVIDSATYLFTISSPDIDNVAMSLYDIIGYDIYVRMLH